MFDVIIIGGGLVGNYLSWKLSEDFDILMIEEHERIGYPKKCSGLVSWRIEELIKPFPKEMVVKKVKEARFLSNYFEVKGRCKRSVYVIRREKLDEILFKRSEEGGTRIKLGERYLGSKNLKECVKVKTNKGIYRGKILIGADGANSSVAKNYQLEQPKEVYVGIQGTTKEKCESVELWFKRKYSNGFFAWVIPENGRVRIGLATKNYPSYFYRKFLKDRIGRYVKPDTFGIIRVGLIKRSVYERVLLVGDAASQIKPFSGGGIIYSLLSSNVAIETIKKSFEMNDFSLKFLLENYEKEWKKILIKPIKLGIILRRLTSFYPFLDFLFPFLSFTKLINLIDMDLLFKQ